MRIFKEFLKEDVKTTLGNIKKSKKYIHIEGGISDDTKVIITVVDRDTKGMRGSQDKYEIVANDMKGKRVASLGSHPSENGAKKFILNNFG